MGLPSYARWVACCTLLLVMTGAAVTSSRDLSRQGVLQDVHTAAGWIDAALLAGLLLWIFRAAPAARLRPVAWMILALTAGETGLGELLRHGSSGPVAGTLHALLAAMLFASVAVVDRCTSLSWTREAELVQDYGWPSLRFLSGGAALFVAVQVGFGAGFRHSAVGILPHLLGAMVVALFIMIVGAFVSHQFPKHPTLRPMAVALMSITGIQVFLGMTAFLMRLMQAAGTLAFLAVSVAHIATGNLTFAVSVLLAMEVRRSVRPRDSMVARDGS